MTRLVEAGQKVLEARNNRHAAARVGRTNPRHAVASPLLSASTVAIALVVATLATACGTNPGSGVASLGSAVSSTTAPVPPGQPTAASDYANGLKYAHCMRTSGESGFPDPTNPGGFPTAAIERLNPSSPQFGNANTRCVRLLPNDGQPTPVELQQITERGLKFASCMRAHGQPGFPDPGVSNGQISINFTDLDPNSAQFKVAEQTCGRIIGS
jgi:hypothetical protein